MRKEEVIFQESQKFALWARLLPVAIILLPVFIQLIIFGKDFLKFSKDFLKFSLDNLLISPAVMLLPMIVLLMLIPLMKMNTIVNNDGVYVKLFPFYSKYEFFPWDTIAKSYIRKYDPILEYRGWGFKHRWIRVKTISNKAMNINNGNNNNIAYNLSGNIGLQLVFTNGKRLLIGTHKPEELTETLRELGKLSE
jgi:hypothetical protein